ncbi:four-carbon acid sugar kinase family protein [Paracoccus sp. MBLB3053]|uniref:Four-carbon acid sugar kinase family protein n=1 Tax=Paracoccus aurantius TaxID=3073814 RepID=A0ABU2HXK2_9RHOB|nr:four-carbon acid sugar kinase family protein [Paracoccus sp. MBLB3053]MDS9469782.1 four-carbon acid sugar kinase family protein [Paracoccus sp. MBLB3053]
MPLSLAIIGDDLTGALDASAPFASRGLAVAVALGPQHVSTALSGDPDVIAVTTESREISPQAAHDAVRRVIGALPAVRILKKVDSRLKGNIEAELSAFEFGCALAAPAIPEFGRIVQAGAVTGFGIDAPIPVRERLGIRAAPVAVPDVTTVAEMHAALDAAGDALLIGARGLADALAERMVACAPRRIRCLPGPQALFVLGSRDPITLSQADLLRDMPGTTRVVAPNGIFRATLPDVPRLLLQAVPGSEPRNAEEVSAALARAVVPLLRPGFGTVLLSGGATAAVCLRAAGADVLRVRGECLPGLVVAEWEGSTVITKSGGFGEPDCLTRIAAMVGTARA